MKKLIVTNNFQTHTRLVKLFLKHDKANQERLYDSMMFRNEIWNRALLVWNDMYDQYKPYKEHPEENIMWYTFTPKTKKRKNKDGSITFTPYVAQKITYHAPAPTWRRVRDRLTANKKESDYLFPNHLVSNVCKDLGKAWDNFFNPDMPDHQRPKLKEIDHFTMSYIDDQARIKNGKLILAKGKNDKTKYKPIRFSESKKFHDGPLKAVNIVKKDNGYYAAIPIQVNCVVMDSTGQDDAVDVNVGHFESTTKKINTLPVSLLGIHKERKHKPDLIIKRGLYDKVAHHQRMLAHKRLIHGTEEANKHKRYQKVRSKLRAEYRKVRNIQKDIVQKFTTYLVLYHDKIVIEDLDVKHMKMGIASKGLHRAMFGYFREILTYKCAQYGRELVLADRFYPSTQTCPQCGLIKTDDEKITLSGNKKHHTKHDEFICYGCGFKADRDEKVPPTLLRFNPETTMNFINQQRKDKKEKIYAF